MGHFPALRIAVTNKCNLNCQYCPKDGDSYLLENPPLSLTDFIQICQIANKEGINSFSLTGGEPLVVPQITFPLAKAIKKLKNLSYLKINTNGVFLSKYIKEIIDSGFDEVKVSLDTLVPNCTKTSSHYQSEVNPIIQGLEELTKHHLPVRLQVVLTKNNFGQIDYIVNFCIDHKIDLKLFDLTYYVDSISQNKTYWQSNYISLNKISPTFEKRFGKPEIIYAVGGYGHPKKVFTTPNQTKIILRDCETSAFYINECKKCSNFMCQDGLCTLTLSADGRLKVCRPKGIDLGLNLRQKDNTLKSTKEIRQLVNKALKLFHQAKEIKRNFSELNLPYLE
jgi:molybdenum cofactor biosynthesis enzyme MoaA